MLIHFETFILSYFGSSVNAVVGLGKVYARVLSTHTHLASSSSALLCRSHPSNLSNSCKLEPNGVRSKLPLPSSLVVIWNCMLLTPMDMHSPARLLSVRNIVSCTHQPRRSAKTLVVAVASPQAVIPQPSVKAELLHEYQVIGQTGNRLLYHVIGYLRCSYNELTSSHLHFRHLPCATLAL